ncbi:MAG TPA: UDP-N-acetylmuramoyl-L-alanine--D-glutamate ligase [Candidatus Borkfalkia faecigallinarum]|uniref:UDP-N-acetylmuramoylalanine--D-glutamate ligase n=1 Tax=Candidatus Borkfalkia faecigallinarum TaxID=2838509 RepID=A0A9D1VU68_9FIRM|nr:UDP-N-acetylmuramoyl-L-alanine--D-glutamate ligase [Candidatus Borkfalkia faecigallinarum]
MNFKTQKFLVAGLSRSGIAAADLLLARGAAVYLYDDRPAALESEQARALRAAGARAVSGGEEGVRACDVLVLSPGIPIDHPLPVLFRRAGKAIVGEAELGCRLLRAPLVAVTGTNGKTTTVAMLGAIFRAAGLRCVPCGNVGRPITSVVGEADEDSVAVAEISSFQLETLSSIRPHVAVVTNVAEDHLDRHYTMENYIFLKSKLLRNLRESEFAVLNRDDPIVREMAEKVRCPVRWFSLRGEADGAFFRDGALYFADEKIMDAERLSLGGEHNVRNALAAACAARLMGVETGAIAAALSSMPGVRHRIRPVACVRGIEFIDDSKGTNVDAALSAVACMRKDTVLLLGGKDKGYDYGRLFAGLRGSRVVCCVLYGENRFRLLDAAVRAGEPRIALVPKFDLAVRVAAMTAKAGQAVLLSPASSSFDEFSGYEERGDRFAAIVRGEGLPGRTACAPPSAPPSAPPRAEQAPPAEQTEPAPFSLEEEVPSAEQTEPVPPACGEAAFPSPGEGSASASPAGESLGEAAPPAGEPFGEAASLAGEPFGEAALSREEEPPAGQAGSVAPAGQAGPVAPAGQTAPAAPAAGEGEAVARASDAG